MPFKWSVSWRMARASNSSPLVSKNSPLGFWARTLAIIGRVTFSRKVGILRQPSSLVCEPERKMISGLIRTRRSEGFSPALVSITARRIDKPICGAARPTPFDAHIVSNMSCTNLLSSEPKSTTGAAGISSTGSGYLTMRYTMVLSNSSLARDIRGNCGPSRPANRHRTFRETLGPAQSPPCFRR